MKPRRNKVKIGRIIILTEEIITDRWSLPGRWFLIWRRRKETVCIWCSCYIAQGGAGVTFFLKKLYKIFDAADFVKVIFIHGCINFAFKAAFFINTIQVDHSLLVILYV